MHRPVLAGFVAVVIGVLVTSALVRVPAATATSGPSCHGERATLVGAPDQLQLRGTGGRDVVVTNGSGLIDTFRGDDLICVTGDRWYVVGNAGPGDDVVDATAAGDRAFTAFVLRAGRDRYVGGPGKDRVTADTEADDTGGDDDVIDTGAGDDFVGAGADGPRAVGRDVVRLGPGRDIGRVTGSGSRVDGGPGQDSLDAEAGGGGRTTLYDGRRGRASARGQVLLRWAGIESYALHAGRIPLAFHGTRRSEAVEVELLRFRHPTDVTLDLAGGDDSVVVNPRLHLRIDGGSGQDQLRMSASRDDSIDMIGDVITVDLSQHVLRYSRPHSPVSRSTLHGIEDVAVETYTAARLTGDDGPNRLTAYTFCSTTLAGRGGDDVLVGTARSSDDCHGADLRGGPGDDRMTGGGGDDTLVGHGGDDTADGRGGTDQCVAERIRRCEARL